ncbi:MAG: DNRLRE domain-containing protein [Phycisphaerales bacterium]
MNPKMLVAAGALAVAAPLAAGDVVQITTAKDNTLYEDTTGNLSNGAGAYMFCGMTSLNLRRRALMMFDVPAAVPAGSTINSVTLTLNMSQTIAFDTTCGLHPVSADWGQGASVPGGNQGGGIQALPGDATWLHTFWNTQTWATPGGDFNAAPSATQTVGVLGVYTWGSTAGMTADVQSWLDQPATNFGWMIVGDETATSTAKRFDTHEHPVVASRPVLTIDYTPPCYPDCNNSGTLSVADFGCFQGKYVLGDMYADCNASGTLSVADFGCFQGKYVLGCP